MWSENEEMIVAVQWTQLMQLRKRSQKKIQDFNGVWTRDLAITDAMWSYTEISRSEKGVKCVNHDIILEFVFVR